MAKKYKAIELVTFHKSIGRFDGVRNSLVRTLGPLASDFPRLLEIERIPEDFRNHVPCRGRVRLNCVMTKEPFLVVELGVWVCVCVCVCVYARAHKRVRCVHECLCAYVCVYVYVCVCGGVSVRMPTDHMHPTNLRGSATSTDMFCSLCLCQPQCRWKCDCPHRLPRTFWQPRRRLRLFCPRPVTSNR